MEKRKDIIAIIFIVIIIAIIAIISVVAIKSGATATLIAGIIAGTISLQGDKKGNL